ncbi:hypothetical protein [Tardiphaga sp. P5_C7]
MYTGIGGGLHTGIGGGLYTGIGGGLYAGIGGGLYSGIGGGLYSGIGGGLFAGPGTPYMSNQPPLPDLIKYLKNHHTALYDLVHRAYRGAGYDVEELARNS